MKNNKTIVIGISGASGSGKSLLANNIVNELGTDQVAVISEDSYYKDQSHLPFEERTKINYDHPNSIDHLLLSEHLAKLQNWESVDIPLYDHSQHIRKTETKRVGDHRIIVLEGILLFVDPELRNKMNIKIYMDTPSDICLIRRLRRDIVERARTFDSVIEQYESTVRPMYLRFIEPSRLHADLIVPRGGENRIAIDMIKAKMRELLGNDA
ncbi:MAG: uridine kinase [Gammaproteobacteria bacterium]|nr:uridine kinase [Gammaproteobacteria bacterium]